MKTRTVRDVIGDPESWENHISDAADSKLPNLVCAKIQDVFSSGNQLRVYTRNSAGVEALSVFFINDTALRAQVANLLVPGLDVHEAVAIQIDQ